MPELTKSTGMFERRLSSPDDFTPPPVSKKELNAWGITVSEFEGNVVVRIPYRAFKEIAPASAHRFEAEATLNSILDAAGIDPNRRFKSTPNLDFSVTFSQTRRRDFDKEWTEPFPKDIAETVTEPGKTQFASGAQRSNDVAGKPGKFPPRYDLITPIGLRRLAETCGEGAAKYGDHNWRKGIPVSNLMNHAMAHLFAYLSGDKTEDHLAHASWNLFAIMHFEETRQEQLDLFDLKTDDYASL